MENKAMYLSTSEERENVSIYEEAYDGRNLSKLNLCDEGNGNNWAVKVPNTAFPKEQSELQF